MQNSRKIWPYVHCTQPVFIYIVHPTQAWLLTNGDNMPTAHDTRMFIMKWYLNMWHVKVAAIRRRLGLRPNANTILV
jgi:hypothetical protein